MYLEGDPRNAADGILQELSEAEKRSVIVSFVPVQGESAVTDPNARVGSFDVTLRMFKARR